MCFKIKTIFLIIRISDNLKIIVSSLAIRNDFTVTSLIISLNTHCTYSTLAYIYLRLEDQMAKAVPNIIHKSCLGPSISGIDQKLRSKYESKRKRINNKKILWPLYNLYETSKGVCNYLCGYYFYIKNRLN